MARLARKRHLRHGHFERTDRSKRLRAFLAERAESLEDTGAITEFTADEAQAASAVLVLSGIPEPNDSITIGEQQFLFVAEATEPNHIEIGVDAPATAAEAEVVINALIPGLVTATAEAEEITVVAVAPGAEGNGIPVSAEGEALSWESDETEGGTSGATFTAAAHGFIVGDGPFLLTTSDALPLGLSEEVFYWIYSVPSANTFTLTTKRHNAPEVTYSDSGEGSLSMAKADAQPAIFEYLRQNAPEVVRDAEDVDDLS